MQSPLDLSLDALAFVIEAALQRLGELGQPGVDALNALIVTRGQCDQFDAGADLLDKWLNGKS